MPLSKRTKKRFVILCAILLVLMSGAGVVYALREGQLNRHALAALDDGLAAYEQEEYDAALHKIGTYLQRHDEDAEVDTLYAYADCRLNVPVPNDRHITQGITLMERVLEKDPAHADGIETLLELRLAVGQTLEALALTDRVLARDPDHMRAHEARVWAHQISGNLDAAIDAAKAQQARYPDDIEVARRLIGLMLEVPKQRRVLVESEGRGGLLDEMRREHAQDPAYLLLLAQAYRALEDAEAGQDCLQVAIDLDSADGNTAKRIALEMMRSDTYGFEPALSYVGTVLRGREDADGLRLWLAQQHFFLGETQAAGQLAQGIETVSDAYVSAQALLALLAGDRGDIEAAGRHTDTIRQQGTAEAQPWVAVLDALLLTEAPKASEVRPVLLDALEADPNNRYFHYALALAYRDLGEVELATQRLAPIVQAEPAWWLAGLELARLLESTGNFSAAYQVLQELYRLHPTVDGVRIRWAVITSLALSPNDPVAARELYDELVGFNDEVIARHPAAAAALRLSEARCLGILDRTDLLVQTLRQILATTEDPAAISVCREINRRYKLGLDDELAGDLYERPIVDAMREAEVLIAQGDSAQALAVLDAALAGNELEQAARDLTRLRFMDRHQLEGARESWRVMLDRYPTNPGLIREAAESAVVLASEELAPDVIGRLKAFTGEEGLAWRFAELRHQALRAESEAQRIEVADRLGAMIRGGYVKTQARLLLAEIFLELDNARGAFSQLVLAVKENPYDARANLALVRLGVREGHDTVAKTALSRLGQIENLAPGIAAEVARLADHLGERTIVQMMRARPGVEPYLHGGERLVQLRSALIRGDQAVIDPLAAKLLASDDLQVLHRLAVLQALYGGEESIEQAIEALSNCEGATPSLLAVTRATIAELTGQPQEAFAILQAAVQADAGSDQSLRIQYVRMLLGQADGLAASVQMLRRLPEDVLSEADRAALFCFEHAMGFDEPRRGILQTLGLEAISSDRPAVFRQAAQAMIETPWEQGRGGQVPGERLFARLDTLRTAYPDEVGLYNLTAGLYLLANQPEQAITMALQTRQRFEDDAVSARLLAQVYIQTRQWNLALRAAEAWRGLATPTRENLEAIDLLTAAALIETGDPGAALIRLQDYGSDRAVVLTVRALVRANRLPDAEAILFPRLHTDSARWRVVLMQLVLTEVLSVNAQVAGRWLDEVESQVPADATHEQLLWAQAQFAVSQQLDHDARQGRAYTLLRSIQDDPAFPSSGWMLLGVCHELHGGLQPAEAAYRQALAMNPAQHQAANNLASLLFARGEAAEARRLSEQAVALTQARPHADYLDTLAQIERAAGRTQLARELWAQALRLDRETPAWYLKQADLLLELGETDQARDTLRQMRQWADPIADDDTESQDWLNRLEQALADERAQEASVPRP